MYLIIMRRVNFTGMELIVEELNNIKEKEKDGYRVVREIKVSSSVGKKYIRCMTKHDVEMPNEIHAIVEEVFTNKII